ncbi:MAG: alpha/beta fold hydrolase [Alphaproteobacteria bacterium]|nr:alpha/beta fold hydrolase [Alphaproteobacteria bacterium]
MADGDDIFGDAVNIASRIESMTEPGGVCLSRQAHDQVADKLPVEFVSVGPQHLKNIARPVEVFAVVLAGDGRRPDLRQPVPESSQGPIKFCRARDGVRIAYRSVGSGPLMVRTGSFLSHLEHDWPCYGHLWGGLARTHTLLRFDQRGNGASDWDVDNYSMDWWVQDLEAVVDAAGAEQFVLVGLSQGVGISLAYAAKHPERVSRLILFGGAGIGPLVEADAEAREKHQAMTTLARIGWNDPTSAFRQMFTSQFMPDVTREQADAYNAFLLKAASNEAIARYRLANTDYDTRPLWPTIQCPTLCLRPRDDAMSNGDRMREMARTIPNARYVSLEGRNHVFTATEPAAERFFEEVELFLNG